MPEIRGESLFSRVDAFGTDPLELRVQIQNDVDDPNGLRLDAEIDGSAGAMAVPVNLTPQKVSMRVYVDGELLPQLAHCSVTRSRDQNLQTWEFSVPIREGVSHFAGIFLGRGSNLRKRRIDIVGVYKTSTGYHEVREITNGICNDDGREQKGKDGAIITFTGVDRGGRYDQELIDLVIPPGSGLPRDRVVAIAARRAGVEDISLDHSDVQMMHEFQLADGNFIPACQELADVEGRQIQWDRQGNMIWRQYGSTNILPERPVWSFTERNFVRGTCKLAQAGELITEITVEGEQQVLSGPCGDVTSRVVITTKSLAPLLTPAYSQGSSSSYTANPAPAPPLEPRTVKVETFDTTKRCGILVYERRTVQEYFNPEAMRYQWNAATDSWDTLAGVYTDDNTDDDSPAYRFSTEHWLTTEIDETWHYWLRGGFEGPEAFLIPMRPPGLDMGYGLRAPKGWDGLTGGNGFIPPGGGDHSYAPGFEGCKIGTLSKSQRWKGIRTYVKQRAVTSYPYPIWETVEPSNGWQVLGGKEAITSSSELFIETERVLTILGTDGRGYQTDEDVYRFEYFVRKGAPYLYGDDTERAESAETQQFTGAVYTQFVGVPPESRNEIETKTDQDDRTTDSVQTTGIDSYLPSADRIPDSGPPTETDIYTDEDESDELYARAYRTESKPISVTVTDDELESNSTRGVKIVHSQYVENEDEADWLARWLLEEGAAGVFTGDLAGANFFIEPGDECSTVRYRKIGLEGMRGRVESVTIDWTPGEVLNTAVEILLYPAN